MVEGRQPAFEAMSDVVLAIASQRSLDDVLQQLVTAARELVGARYAAVGVPDEDGEHFARFITQGMSDEQITAIGPLPRQHGLLGAMLRDPQPFRTPDITADERFRWWPSAHPRMRSFLGVPIVARGAVVGAFYLTDKLRAAGEAGAQRPTAGGEQQGEAGAGEAVEFSQEDQRLIELLAAHAAIAIENARLFDLTRELSVVEERARLAGELHDALNQTLFSLSLVAEAGDLALVKELTRAALAELRALIEGLRPPRLEADGLVAALAHHVDVLRRAHRLDVRLAASGVNRLEPDEEREVLRIAQEALSNVLRHASARQVRVRLVLDGGLELTVHDDGRGFDPAALDARARRLGLTSMHERARRLHGDLSITSAPGAGTTVRLEISG